MSIICIVLLLVSCLTCADIMDKLTGKEMTNDPPNTKRWAKTNAASPLMKMKKRINTSTNKPTDEDMRRGHRKRKLTEKMRENKMKELQPFGNYTTNTLRKQTKRKSD